MSTIWIEFTPAVFANLKTLYLAASVNGVDNINQAEAIQAMPMVDATGTRMMVGSSRIDVAKALAVKGVNANIKIHQTFPSDWVYPVVI